MSDTQDVEALVARLDEVSCDPDLSTRQRADIDEAATALRTLARERDEAREAVRRTGVWDFPRDIQNLNVKVEAAEQDVRDLCRAIMGAEPDPSFNLTPRDFISMAATLHAAADGGRARASSLEAQLAGAKEGLERVRDECQCTIDLYDRHGPSFTSPAGDQYEPTSFVIDKMGNLFAIAAEALASAPASAGVGVKMPDDARIRELMKGVGFEHMHHPGGKP